MDLEEKNTNLGDKDFINSRRRGDILFYSLSQVASLLEQEESNILYFTSVFDDILNIKISDKELTYTDKDIDKLEFLINLKNKGMTIKEIQRYCEELSFENEELIGITEKTSTSINDIIETISKSANEQIENLKEFLTNQIDRNNEILSEKIIKVVKEEQSKNFNSFKEELISEMKEYIDSRFDVESEVNSPLYNKVSTKIDELLAEKLSIEENIRVQFDKFNDSSASRDSNLIDEIKKFRTVIEKAYYVQQEVEKNKEKTNIFNKLFPANN